VFDAVIAVTFQSALHSEIHENNFFFKKRILLLLSVHQNNLKISKKNNSKKFLNFIKHNFYHQNKYLLRVFQVIRDG